MNPRFNKHFGMILKTKFPVRNSEIRRSGSSLKRPRTNKVWSVRARQNSKLYGPDWPHISEVVILSMSAAWSIRGSIKVLYAAKSKKVMYSITFVILPVTKTIFCTRGCFSASLGLKINIDSLSWPYSHLRLSNLSFPALVTPENNHS